MQIPSVVQSHYIISLASTTSSPVLMGPCLSINESKILLMRIATINLTLFLYLHLTFVFLLGHFHFFLKFFFTYMKTLSKKHLVSYEIVALSTWPLTRRLARFLALLTHLLRSALLASASRPPLRSLFARIAHFLALKLTGKWSMSMNWLWFLPWVGRDRDSTPHTSLWHLFVFFCFCFLFCFFFRR